MDRLPAASSIQTENSGCALIDGLSFSHMQRHARARALIQMAESGICHNPGNGWTLIWTDLNQRRDRNKQFAYGCSLESAPFQCIPPGLAKLISKCYMDFWSIRWCLMSNWSGRHCRGSLWMSTVRGDLLWPVTLAACWVLTLGHRVLSTELGWSLSAFPHKKTKKHLGIHRICSISLVSSTRNLRPHTLFLSTHMLCTFVCAGIIR